MTSTIVILDDELDRLEAMNAILSEELTLYKIVWWIREVIDHL